MIKTTIALIAALVGCATTQATTRTNGVSTDVPAQTKKSTPKAQKADPTVKKAILERRDELKVRAETAAAEAKRQTGKPAKVEGLFFPGVASATADLGIVLLRLTENGKDEVLTAAIFRWNPEVGWDVLPFEFYPYGYTGE